MKRIAVVGLVAVAVATTASPWGCRRAPRPGAQAEAKTEGEASARGETTPPRLQGVVDPWTWPGAAGTSDRQRALEDIGPYERVAPARPDSMLLNSNADYWTTLVGIAWTRDVDIDFDNEPVDLDADGVPDAHITRHVHARGGILANPELFGLLRTPDDPRGNKGRISTSTGLLGLREALTADGNPSGQIGMTCFLCHGGRDPVDGRVILGLPGTAFDYGLLLATAAVLDDTNPVAASYRRERGFPSGRRVRARLLLAGPGRQDLTGEFGLDVTIPGIHSGRYPGADRVRQGTSGIVNPISVPGILSAAGVDLQNWSGSEIASARWLRRVIALGAPQPAGQTLRRLGLPALADVDDLRASATTRRALLLDLRNLGTLGLQQDSFPGLLWADAIYGRADLGPDDLANIPSMYATAAIRRVLARESVPPLAGFDRPPRMSSIARGRDIFVNRVVGVIANRQILKEPPPRYAAAQPGGPAHAPIVAPIDEALPSAFPVRCADCHNATPGGAFVPLSQAPPPLGRCSHCHHGHVTVDGPSPALHQDNNSDRDGDGAGAGAGARGGDERHPLSWFRWQNTTAAAEVALCTACHQQHRPFAPVVYSSGMLLPFDADGDGVAQDDERDDARAGGIGTEALLAFDVPRPQRPATGFAMELPSLEKLHSIGRIGVTRVGVSWVRVAPLLGVRATAPYLHNGSVPTLRALLEPARQRPVTFPLGQAGFVFDTRLSGNRNLGHEFGTNLNPREKDDLIAFLESL